MEYPWTLPRLVLFWLLNVFDIFSTIWLLMSGKAQEINPLMVWMLDLGIHYFVGFKLITITGACLFLYWHRKIRLAQVAINLVLAAYLALLVWHSYLIWIASQ